MLAEKEQEKRQAELNELLKDMALSCLSNDDIDTKVKEFQKI